MGIFKINEIEHYAVVDNADNKCSICYESFFDAVDDAANKIVDVCGYDKNKLNVCITHANVKKVNSLRIFKGKKRNNKFLYTKFISSIIINEEG